MSHQLTNRPRRVPYAMMAVALVGACVIAIVLYAKHSGGTPTPATHPPVLNLGQRCGVFEHRDFGAPPEQTQNIAGCFLGAWRTCSAASFTTRFVGTDAWSEKTYVVRQGSPCEVVIRTSSDADGIIMYQADRTCGSLAEESYGLRISACGGPPDEAVVMVHDAGSIRMGNDCGTTTLTDGTMATDPAQARTEAQCISSAFATCHPATAAFLGDSFSGIFLIEQAERSCLISHVSLERGTDGTDEPTWAELCSGMSLVSTTVTFACDRGDYSITWNSGRSVAPSNSPIHATV